MDAIDHIRQTRKNFEKLMDGLTLEQLNTVPKGFNNSILWNYGHAIVTMQLLCYKLSGLDMNLPEKVVAEFRKGTAPERNFSQEEVDELKHLSSKNLDQLVADLESGVFTNFTPYETSFGVTLSGIEEAISFNAVHEGMHLGSVLALKRLVAR